MLDRVEVQSSASCAGPLVTPTTTAFHCNRITSSGFENGQETAAAFKITATSFTSTKEHCDQDKCHLLSPCSTTALTPLAQQLYLPAALPDLHLLNNFPDRQPHHLTSLSPPLCWTAPQRVGGGGGGGGVGVVLKLFFPPGDRMCSFATCPSD